MYKSHNNYTYWYNITQLRPPVQIGLILLFIYIIVFVVAVGILTIVHYIDKYRENEKTIRNELSTKQITLLIEPVKAFPTVHISNHGNNITKT